MEFLVWGSTAMFKDRARQGNRACARHVMADLGVRMPKRDQHDPI